MEAAISARPKENYAAPTQSYRLHNARVTTSVTIRDVPDETRDELAARAALTGRSMQEYLRTWLIGLARQPEAESLMARIHARKAATGLACRRSRFCRMWMTAAGEDSHRRVFRIAPAMT